MTRSSDTPRLREGGLEDGRVIAILEAHLKQMHAQSPPESVHALDLSGLKGTDVTFWSLWLDEEAVGCGALKTLVPDHGEIKSMHVLAKHRGKGLADLLMLEILRTAKARGMKRLSLETGAPDDFKAAQDLYRKYGFEECGPFADYKLDPFSLFMTKAL